MAINDSNLQTELWSEVYSKLSGGALSASDVHNSSVTPSIGGGWNGSKKVLPRITIGNPNVASLGIPRFNDGFDCANEAYVELRIRSTVNKHLDQYAQQIRTLFRNSEISGVVLTGWEEDNDLVDPVDGVVYGKTLMLTFRR